MERLRWLWNWLVSFFYAPAKQGVVEYIEGRRKGALKIFAVAKAEILDLEFKVKAETENSVLRSDKLVAKELSETNLRLNLVDEGKKLEDTAKKLDSILA